MPGELLQDGQDKHQGVLGDGDRIRAAVIGDRHPGPAGGPDVETVVAGADQLDQLELGRPAIELRAEALAREPHEVLGVFHGRGELGRTLLGDVQLELGWQERAGDVDERRGELRGENDLGRHGCLLSTGARGRYHRARATRNYAAAARAACAGPEVMRRGRAATAWP